MGTVLRWLGASNPLAASVNSARWSHARRAEANWQVQMPLSELSGRVLAAGYTVHAGATVRSPGGGPGCRSVRSCSGR